MAGRSLPARGIALACVVGATLLAVALARAQQPAPPAVTFAAQGWSDADRATFYTTSQGSHVIPFAWFKALRQHDVDAPFGADQLTRYGYLRNDDPGNINGLPVGFVVEAKSGQLGLTCAACHTGQLEFVKDGVTRALRLDGAPALSDFQQFLTDLAAATQATRDDGARFDAFAKGVLGAGGTPAKTAQLKSDFTAWVNQFSEFMDASLPASPWGPGRLDAFGMIFNRVSARDLGITANFKRADAPVSYPFIWNAPRQDRTQWNGGVPNGLFIQGLARNTGEVFGVFADFKPRALIPGHVIDYKNNSADFAGLQTLEEKLAALQPPPWPRDLFPIDQPLADTGKPLFDTHCGSCHAERASSHLPRAWNTPVQAVGTDPKTADNAARTSDPGLYTGVRLPPPAITERFANPAKTADILGGSVVGALLDEAFAPPLTPQKLAQSGVWRALRKDLADILPNEKLDDLANPKPGVSAALRVDVSSELKNLITSHLTNLYKKPEAAADQPGAAYESRVLHGIWATAPYLHDGSVASLWELMLPAKQRMTSFKVGSRQFDPKNVGWATDQSPFKSGTYRVDPANANGNGNGGHEFGSTLPEDQRRAILEYLKTL